MNIPMVSALLISLGALPFTAGLLLATWRQRRIVARRSRDLTIEVGPKVLLGVALAGAGTAPALAAESPVTSSSAAPWLPTLDRGPLLNPPAASATEPPHASPVQPRKPHRPVSQQVPVANDRTASDATYVVRHGDSLWSITAQHLGPQPSVRDVAASWPHLYELNRSVIGPNPRLLIPGQRLVLPTGFVTVAQ